MRLFSLGGRLLTAASFIPDGATVADVGTDHCRLPIWLVATGKIDRAIATDIRSKPLDRARENCLRWETGDRIELRLSDGLEAVAPEECGCVVICGMGGDTIAAILSRAPWTADGAHTLVLQAETSARDLRRWLYNSGYLIEDERAVIDGGRVYTVIKAAGGSSGDGATPLYEYLSRPLTLQRDAAARQYFTRVRRGVERELRGLTPGTAAYDEKEAVYRLILKLEGEDAEGQRDT